MKKFLVILCAGFLLWGLPAAADILIVTGLDGNPSTDDPVGLVGDENPTWNLPNYDEDTEEAWLEGLLNLYYDDPSVEFFYKIEFQDDNAQDPNYWDDYMLPVNAGQGLGDWAYAIVKWGGSGGGWAAAFMEDPNDGDTILTLPESFNFLSRNAISHISFFRSVPEPSNMLLLGTGLIGLAGIARRKYRKS